MDSQRWWWWPKLLASVLYLGTRCLLGERERERRPDSVATISLIDISVCSARLLGRGGKFGVLGEEIKRRSSFSPVRL